MPRKQIERPGTAVLLKRAGKQVYTAMRTLQKAVTDSAASADVARWTADLIRIQNEIHKRLMCG
jgi:ribosomal protein S20